MARTENTTTFPSPTHGNSSSQWADASSQQVNTPAPRGALTRADIDRYRARDCHVACPCHDLEEGQAKPQVLLHISKHTFSPTETNIKALNRSHKPKLDGVKNDNKIKGNKVKDNKVRDAALPKRSGQVNNGKDLTPPSNQHHSQHGGMLKIVDATRRPPTLSTSRWASTAFPSPPATPSAIGSQNSKSKLTLSTSRWVSTAIPSPPTNPPANGNQNKTSKSTLSSSRWGDAGTAPPTPPTSPPTPPATPPANGIQNNTSKNCPELYDSKRQDQVHKEWVQWTRNLPETKEEYNNELLQSIAQHNEPIEMTMCEEPEQMEEDDYDQVQFDLMRATGNV